jgi:osmotically inducible protein OsmC
MNIFSRNPDPPGHTGAEPMCDKQAHSSGFWRGAEAKTQEFGVIWRRRPYCGRRRGAVLRSIFGVFCECVPSNLLSSFFTHIIANQGEELMDRKASATWQGGLKDGKGFLSSPSGVLNHTPYSFHTRFESEPGTNPEELIAAAHAGCFSMALSAQLGASGMTPERIDTTATVTLDKQEGGFAVTRVHLVCRARVPGAASQKFLEIAEAAKSGCPISKLLNAKITLDAGLVNEFAAD